MPLVKRIEKDDAFGDVTRTDVTDVTTYSYRTLDSLTQKANLFS